MSFSLSGVSVRYAPTLPQHALSDVTLNIARGEQLALIGPSGAGKTTLLHTLALARAHDEGSFTAFGTEPWKLSSTQRHGLRTRLFLAPQTPPLPPRQRVVTAVLAGRLPQWTLGQALLSLLKPADPGAAYEALSRFNLQDKLYARVDRLSGGERQRCSLARLIVSDAEAFLIDEPLSALDPTLARQTIDVLQQEAARRNASMVCSLHQVEFARALFPRIVGLRHGRIIFDAPSEKVSDRMIADLYQQGGLPAADSNDPGMADSIATAEGKTGRRFAPGCF